MFKADGERRDFPIRKSSITVGRKHTCDLRIPLGIVSREHCRVELEDDTLTVRDLGSSNGTYHNSERVQEATLEAGDTLVIGPVHFTVVIDGEPAEIAEPVKTVLPEGADEVEASEAGSREAPVEAEEDLDEISAEESDAAADVALEALAGALDEDDDEDEEQDDDIDKYAPTPKAERGGASESEVGDVTVQTLDEEDDKPAEVEAEADESDESDDDQREVGVAIEDETDPEEIASQQVEDEVDPTVDLDLDDEEDPIAALEALAQLDSGNDDEDSDEDEDDPFAALQRDAEEHEERHNS